MITIADINTKNLAGYHALQKLGVDFHFAVSVENGGAEKEVSKYTKNYTFKELEEVPANQIRPVDLAFVGIYPRDSIETLKYRLMQVVTKLKPHEVVLQDFTRQLLNMPVNGTISLLDSLSDILLLSGYNYRVVVRNALNDGALEDNVYMAIVATQKPNLKTFSLPEGVTPDKEISSLVMPPEGDDMTSELSYIVKSINHSSTSTNHLSYKNGIHFNAFMKAMVESGNGASRELSALEILRIKGCWDLMDVDLDRHAYLLQMPNADVFAVLYTALIGGYLKWEMN